MTLNFEGDAEIPAFRVKRMQRAGFPGGHASNGVPGLQAALDGGRRWLRTLRPLAETDEELP